MAEGMEGKGGVGGEGGGGGQEGGAPERRLAIIEL